FNEVINVSCTLEQLIEQFAKIEGENQPNVEVVLKNGQCIQSDCSIIRLEVKQETEQYYLVLLHNVHNKKNIDLSQQFSGSFMKDVNLGIILMDTDFKIVNISDVACTILGLEKLDTMNKGMDEVFANVPIEHQIVQ